MESRCGLGYQGQPNFGEYFQAVPTTDGRNLCAPTVKAQAFKDQSCLVSCDGSTPDLFELFIRCVAAAVEGIPTNAGTWELEAGIVNF